MRLGPKDKFWVVTDPAPRSELADVLFESSLEGMRLQFKGGLTIEENPTIFTDRGEAEVEAKLRLDHELDEQRKGLTKIIQEETAKGLDADFVRLGIRVTDDEDKSLEKYRNVEIDFLVCGCGGKKFDIVASKDESKPWWEVETTVSCKGCGQSAVLGRRGSEIHIKSQERESGIVIVETNSE